MHLSLRFGKIEKNAPINIIIIIIIIITIIILSHTHRQLTISHGDTLSHTDMLGASFSRFT